MIHMGSMMDCDKVEGRQGRARGKVGLPVRSPGPSTRRVSCFGPGANQGPGSRRVGSSGTRHRLECLELPESHGSLYRSSQATMGESPRRSSTVCFLHLLQRLEPSDSFSRSLHHVTSGPWMSFN